MISFAKTYEENIVEYKHYERFVDDLICGRGIGIKYKMLLEGEDIFNIVCLALIRWYSSPDYKKESINYITDFFETMDFNSKVNVFKAARIEFIVHHSLDEVPAFRKVMNEYSNKVFGTHAQGTQQIVHNSKTSL